MIDLGLTTYFLGMEVLQSTYQISSYQAKYARDLLKQFKMSSCKAVNTPLTIGFKFNKKDGALRQMEKFTKASLDLFCICL